MGSGPAQAWQPNLLLVQLPSCVRCVHQVVKAETQTLCSGILAVLYVESQLEAPQLHAQQFVRGLGSGPEAARKRSGSGPEAVR